MSQSTLLVGAVFGAFILYLALTKRLGVYWSLLTGGTGSGSGTSSTGPALPWRLSPTLGIPPYQAPSAPLGQSPQTPLAGAGTT
jgi:hypothetical protein